MCTTYTHAHTYTHTYKGAETAQSVQWATLQTGQSRNRCEIPGGGKNLSFLRCVQTDSGAHKAFFSVCAGGLFPGGKTVGMLTTYSPSSAKFKKNWRYIPTDTRLHGVHTEKFTSLDFTHASNLQFAISTTTPDVLEMY